MIIAPKKPVIQVKRVRTFTIFKVFFLSFSFEAEISFTALTSSPNFVKPIITFKVEFKTPTIPIPAGPINIAANLDLAIEINTPKT